MGLKNIQNKSILFSRLNAFVGRLIIDIAFLLNSSFTKCEEKKFNFLPVFYKELLKAFKKSKDNPLVLLIKLSGLIKTSILGIHYSRITLRVINLTNSPIRLRFYLKESLINFQIKSLNFSTFFLKIHLKCLI